jgi:hypothetical protein
VTTRTRKTSKQIAEDVEEAKVTPIREGEEEDTTQPEIYDTDFLFTCEDGVRVRVPLGELDVQQITATAANVVNAFKTIREGASVTIQGTDGVLHILNSDKIIHVEITQKRVNNAS